MKEIVYANPVNSVEELTARVNAVAETIAQNPIMSKSLQTYMVRMHALTEKGGILKNFYNK